MLSRRMALTAAVVATGLATGGFGVASGMGSTPQTKGEIPGCTGDQPNGVLCFMQLAINRVAHHEQNVACTFRVICHGLAPGGQVIHYVKRPAGPRSGAFAHRVTAEGTFSADFGVGPDSSFHVTSATVPVTSARRIQIVSNTVSCP